MKGREGERSIGDGEMLGRRGYCALLGEGSQCPIVGDPSHGHLLRDCRSYCRGLVLYRSRTHRKVYNLPCSIKLLFML
jgi:hypothetical protein